MDRYFPLFVCLSVLFSGVADSRATTIYWSQGSKIRRSDTDGSNSELLVSDSALGLQLDIENGRMLWTSAANAVKRAELNGGNAGTIVEEAATPFGLAFDSTANRLYWAVPDSDVIKTANGDGSEEKAWLAPHGDDYHPVGVALDPVNAKIYWSEAPPGGEGRIRRANLDGSQKETLYESPMGAPIQLALDVAGGWAYWVNGSNDGSAGAGLGRMKLDGSEAVILRDFTETNYFSSSLALDPYDAKLYWTESLGTTSGALWRSSLDGSSPEKLFDVGQVPRGLALDLSVPGDANGDRVVNLDDFSLLKANFGAGSRRSQGDFNADHQVDLTDFGILKQNFGGGEAAAAPEPTSAALAILAAAGALLWRRRRP